MKNLFLTLLLLGTSSLAMSQTIATANDGDWSAGSTWVGGIPPANTQNAEINHNVTVDANVRVRDLTISSTGVLTNTGRVIRCDEDWTNNGTFNHGNGGRVDFRRNGLARIQGKTVFHNLRINANSKVLLVEDSIFIENTLQLNRGSMTASGTGEIVLFADNNHDGRLGVCNNNGLLVGDFVYMRRMTRGNGWGMYGMPFDKSLAEYASTTGGNMIYTGFTGGENFPTFSWVNTYTFNETASTYDGGFTTPSSTGDVIPRGQGFWYYNTDQTFGGGTISYSQDWIWTMKGSMDIGTPFDFGITYTDNGNATDDGYNLIANPYPGTINWNDGAWTKTNVDDAVYYFRSSNQSAASYVGGVNANGGSNNRIPAGTGFYVKANAAAPSLIAPKGVLINNNRDMRDGSDLEEGEIDEASIPNLLKIILDGDEIAVRLTDEATVNFDGNFDAYKFGGIQHIYSKYGSGDEIYSINSLPTDVTSVPLYTSKDGELLINGIESFANSFDVTLEDKTNGTFTRITEGFGLNYIPAELGVSENRFVLHFSPVVDPLNIEDIVNENANVVLTYNADYINASYALPGNTSAKYQIITIDGKVLENGTLNGENGSVELTRSNAVRLFVVDYNGNKLTYKIL